MNAEAAAPEPPAAWNVAEFLKRSKEIRERLAISQDDPWDPWFRGQPEAKLELKPKLYRGQTLPAKLREMEDEIREEFIKRAPILCEASQAGDERRAEWEWYFMMQHHHAATRLLDWTDGELIALHFAIRGNKGNEDAAVWVLDLYELNRRVIGKDWVIPPTAPGVDPEIQEELAKWLPKRFQKEPTTLPPQPIAIEPTHVVRRMSSQHSCFTIHGSDPGALDKLANEAEPCLFKIVISKSAIKRIETELRRCGIDESTIFPDMDGLGRSINARWGIREDGWPNGAGEAK